MPFLNDYLEARAVRTNPAYAASQLQDRRIQADIAADQQQRDWQQEDRQQSRDQLAAVDNRQGRPAFTEALITNADGTPTSHLARPGRGIHGSQADRMDVFYNQQGNVSDNVASMGDAQLRQELDPSKVAPSDLNKIIKDDGTLNTAYIEGRKAIAASGADNNPVSIAAQKQAQDFLTPSEADALRMIDENGEQVPLPPGITQGDVVDLQKAGKVVRIDPQLEQLQMGYDKDYTEIELQTENFISAMEEYGDLIDKIGPQILPSSDKLMLDSNYTNVQMQLKEILKLGVLAGPDLDLIQQIVANPTSVINWWIENKEPGALRAQLDSVMKNALTQLDNSARILKQKNRPLNLEQRRELKRLEEKYPDEG